MHHAPVVNTTAKNLLSNTSHLGGSSKSVPATSTNMGNTSSSPSHKDLMNFHDQMKKNRPPTKPGDNFPSNTTTNPIMNNPSQMRNMQTAQVVANQASTAPLRRPASGNSPQQVLLSSDDEIMDDSLVGK